MGSRVILVKILNLTQYKDHDRGFSKAPCETCGLTNYQKRQLVNVHMETWSVYRRRCICIRELDSININYKVLKLRPIIQMYY